MDTQHPAPDGAALAARAYPHPQFAEPDPDALAALAAVAERVLIATRAEETSRARREIAASHRIVGWLLDELDPAWAVACYDCRRGEASIAFVEHADAAAAAARFGLDAEPDVIDGHTVWHAWTGRWMEHQVRFEASTLSEAGRIPARQIVVIRAPREAS